MDAVRAYCELLEPYFRPRYWHSGRLAVALGAFLSYALGPDTGHGYLALMTVFEALLSTEKTEITHQISERAALMLETDEDRRYALYKRMKRALQHPQPSCTWGHPEQERRHYLRPAQARRQKDHRSRSGLSRHFQLLHSAL
jgi:hypothetical protein